jgi:hypothetical protein
MSVKATLGGVPLLSDPAVQWESVSGVRPYEATFAVRSGDVQTLAKPGLRTVDLAIDDGEGRNLTIKNLYVIAEEPREFPAVAKVRVVDRRWFWGFKHVSRVFNRRRVVGSARRRAPDTPPELQPLTPKIAYHPATMKNGQTPWTAKEVLENVLASCIEAESDTTGGGAGWKIEPEIGKNLDNLPIEDLELDDSAENALQRVLTYLPEARVKVTNLGEVIVYSALDGKDAALVNATKPELYGFGHVSIVSNANLRPKEVHVLFTREHEVRFDFEETGSPTTIEDARSISNVLPIPDYNLVVGGQQLSQGTWISLVQAFDAWGAPPKLSHLANASAWLPALRRLMVPYMDLWTGIGLAGVRDPNADWMGRIGAIQEHYRRTWQINKDWMDRIEQLKASLVATIDPTTGTRAPALVYADYSRLASQRSLWKDQLDDAEAAYAMNVEGSPSSASAPLSTGRAAPFELSIVDEDQGIIHYDFRPDPWRVHEQAMPGKIGLGSSSSIPGPTSDIEDITKPIAFNMISEQHTPPELTAPFRVAVLMTAIPATTNSTRNLHLWRVKKKATDIAKNLPAGLRKGIETAKGPILEIRVNPSIETARVGWSDDASSSIEQAFGVRNSWSDAGIEDLIINLKGDHQGGASLDAIAEALATKTYAMLADRYQGERSVPLYSGAEPVGHIESVGHEVTTRGAAITNIRLPDKLADIDLFSLLPDSTRRIILRLAPSPGKGT